MVIESRTRWKMRFSKHSQASLTFSSTLNQPRKRATEFARSTCWPGGQRTSNFPFMLGCSVHTYSNPPGFLNVTRQDPPAWIRPELKVCPSRDVAVCGTMSLFLHSTVSPTETANVSG